MSRSSFALVVGVLMIPATIWFGAGGDAGVHYLGHSETTGGIDPAIGTKHDTSNPNGWSNPAPDGPSGGPADHRPVRSPPSGAPLSAPPDRR